ncbi:type II toxin-antitoxin system RelE/ParE family toxin [Sphingomonas sp.]|jgi:plasmid stabilization system protein ParE|uniref:type II toxin-antitoxin system RelE/ParE family toxin n=1 Tax=Sphingomonas sp. TaxID=28214 RepID=UPI002D7F09BE|nr:type II toxin-antitoxin system RelE/ParE family toxin [Sphingomonas sp.]HEU0045473.1 type II toxin-antitoxin system RelE/ParE family toxin [Sphingomonas sp.]
MIQYRVVLSQEAQDEIESLRRYISEAANPGTANGYIDRVLAHTGKLTNFPHRGSPRDDLRPGTRTISFKRRMTIAYTVDEQDVVVLGFAYGGRNLDDLLS